MDLKIRKKEPGRRRGSRTPARKAKELGFRARTVDLTIRKKKPAGRRGSRPPARKANEFGFRARTVDLKIRKKEPAGRPGSRPPARKAKELGFRARTRGTRKTVKRVPSVSRPNRPGSAPVKRCPKVKFKLTIQSENLRFNSKYFYHSEADYKW